MKHFVTLPYLLSMYSTSSGRGFLPLVTAAHEISPSYSCKSNPVVVVAYTHPCNVVIWPLETILTSHLLYLLRKPLISQARIQVKLSLKMMSEEVKQRTGVETSWVGGHGTCLTYWCIVRQNQRQDHSSLTA